MLALQYVLSGAPGASSVASLTLVSAAASGADAAADRRAAAKTLPPATRDLLLSGVRLAPGTPTTSESQPGSRSRIVTVTAAAILR
jgi:hypothetical protein